MKTKRDQRVQTSNGQDRVTIESTAPRESQSADETGVRRSIGPTVILAAKFALMAVIAWLVLSTLAAVFEWGRGPRSVEPVANATLEAGFPAPPVPPVLLSAFEDGAWEFAGMPWQIRMTTVEPGEIAQALEALPTSEEIAAATNSEASRRLVQLLKMTGAKESKLGQFIFYRTDSPTGQMTLVTRSGSEGESVVLGRIAWPEEGRWRLMEGRPTEASLKAETPPPDTPPVDSAATRIATRRGAEGTLLGQILTVESGKEELLAAWRQAGWNVSRSPAAIELTGEAPLLLVERQGVCYTAHFFASPDGTTTFFLTRVPE